MTIDNEPQLRTALRLSLEPGAEEELVLRQGRVIGWLEEALEPLQGELSSAELRRLVLAIRSACGIEALVWLTDVAGLTRRRGGRPDALVGALTAPRDARRRLAAARSPGPRPPPAPPRPTLNRQRPATSAGRCRLRPAQAVTPSAARSTSAMSILRIFSIAWVAR